MKGNHIIRTLFSVTGVIVLAKLLGFVKQMLTAGLFGASIETDLIQLSQGAIGDIQYVLAQTLVTAFVSIYIHQASQSEARARQFTADTVKTFTLISAGIAALLFLAAPVVAKVIAPSYTPELSARLSGYIRLFAPVLILFTWTAIFQALLNANKRFVPGEMIGMNQSVCIILIVVLFAPRLGIRTLVVSFFVCALYNTLFLSTLSRKYWKMTVGNPFSSPAIRELLRMTGPLLLGYAAVYINQLVDKVLLSGLNGGAITALVYGASLSNLITTFICSFSGVLFSYVTTRISQGDHKGAAALANRAAQLQILCFLPISILSIFCAEDVVAIAFGRGAFDATAVHMSAQALRGYAFCFIPLVLREVYSRVQYSYKNSRGPMHNSIISIGVNIALSIGLCPRFGILGVSFASSVGSGVHGVLDLIGARRHNDDVRCRVFLPALPFFLAGATVCGLIARWMLVLLKDTIPVLRFGVIVLCAGIGYLAVVSPLLLRLLRRNRR